MPEAILECVPNFSEGRDAAVVAAIAAAISRHPGIQLLDVDSGAAAHRTVITFVGAPAAVVDAAFHAIATAAEHIDMRRHKGVHPRLGATDVCPLIPVRGLTMEEAAGYARQLGERVWKELGIPVYLYGEAAIDASRRELSAIRSGEYEGLEAKLKNPAWRPDFGEAAFIPASGATVIGARDFLVAYNVNLDTPDVAVASALAAELREKGRRKMVDGRPASDAAGRPLYEPGLLKHVRAIGWFIEEYGRAQVSMNLTRIAVTPVHEAFETCKRCAGKRGVRVTGSELVGLIPLRGLLDAGRYYRQRSGSPTGATESELVESAVAGLGLGDLTPFDPRKKVLEYLMEDPPAF